MRGLSQTILLVAVLGLTPVSAFAAARPAASAASTMPDIDRLVAETKKTMMADPKAALAMARQVTAAMERQPRSPRQQEALATGLWLQGEALTRINEIAKARAVLKRSEEIAAGDGRETKLDGDLALSMARLEDNDSNVAGALQNFQKAHDIFARLGLARGQSLALQGLGSIYDQAHDFAHEVEYYRRALQVYAAEPPLELSIKNNLGFALQQQEKFDAALKDYSEALHIAVSMGSRFLEARILTNIAVVNAKQGRLAEAERAIGRASTLLDAYGDNGWKPFVWGVKAEIAFDRHDLNSAAREIAKAFEGRDLTQTTWPFRDMHKIAYRIYRALGNYRLALSHLEAFKRLDDDGRTLAASANLALMNAKFEFQNQKLEIARLKSEKLQHESNMRQSQIRYQAAVFAALVAFGALILVWIGWRHRILRIHRDQISKANVELTRTLRERDAEIARRQDTEARLRIAKEMAETASRAKSSFLANMSHELRTPLNAIIGFSEILALGMVTPDRVVSYAADISGSGHKLLNILNCTLDMAGLDAGTIMLAEDEVVLGETVEEAIRRVASDLDLGSRQVRATGDQAMAVVVDRARWLQVLENLLSNAVKFTREDGRIGIDVVRIGDGGVNITITDDGCGIPREQLSRVLEPFGQAEGPYVRSHGGIGLGLAIVKSLVELHSGTLTLRSQEGAGTTAQVHLPAARVLGGTGRRQAVAS